MRKKGAVGNEIVMFALALLVFFAVGYSAYLIYTGQFYSIFRLTPTFNSTTDSPVGLEVIGYKMGDGNMYYYAGSNWVKDNGVRMFNQKSVNMGSVGSKIRDSLTVLDIGQGKVVKLSKGDAYIVPKVNFDTGKWFNTQLDKMIGDIHVEARSTKAGYILYYELIIRGGEVYSRDISYAAVSTIPDETGGGGSAVAEPKLGEFEKVNVNGDYKIIFDSVNLWMTEVLNKPVAIDYTVNGGSRSENYCVRKISPDYLVVYLDRPTTAEACN